MGIHKVHSDWHCCWPHLSCENVGSQPRCPSFAVFPKPPVQIYQSQAPGPAMEVIESPQALAQPLHVCAAPNLQTHPSHRSTSNFLQCPVGTELAKHPQHHKSAYPLGIGSDFSPTSTCVLPELVEVESHLLYVENKVVMMSRSSPFTSMLTMWLLLIPGAVLLTPPFAVWTTLHSFGLSLHSQP